MNDTIIYTENSETYRAVIQKLRSSRDPVHCYQLKEDKFIRVVVRGLYLISLIEEFKTEIQDGFEVRSTMNSGGHIRRYCNHAARFVRCGGSNESPACSKKRETEASPGQLQRMSGL